MDSFGPARPPRPRGVLFDLDRTLVDRDRAVIEWACARGGFTEAEVRAAPGFECARDEDVRRFLGWADDGGTDAPTFHLAIARSVHARAGAAELLADLVAADVALGVVTNGGPQQRVKLAASGLAQYFDAARVWVSGLEGVRKPAPGAFLAGARRIGCRPREVMFVGDDLEVDVEGARAVGMRAWHVAPGADLPELLAAWRSWT